MRILFFFLLFAVQAEAASLIWDPTADGFLLLQYSATESGPFTVLKEIPASPPSFPITEFGYYKLTVPNGGPSSNVARYSLDITSDKIAELDARIAALEDKIVRLKAGLCALRGSSLTKDVLAERAALGGC
jgi:uncharacterized small protein (DUF1192 family)